MANWLDKYEQGGLVLKKKTKDNYGKKPNVNDVKVSAGPGFEGDGYTAYNWKSPSWGGQFQMGGALPGAVGFTYARTAGSAPANGKYTKKTKASAQDGKKVDKTSPNEKKYQASDKKEIVNWFNNYYASPLFKENLYNKGLPDEGTKVGKETTDVINKLNFTYNDLDSLGNPDNTAYDSDKTINITNPNKYWNQSKSAVLAHELAHVNQDEILSHQPRHLIYMLNRNNRHNEANRVFSLANQKPTNPAIPTAQYRLSELKDWAQGENRGGSPWMHDDRIGEVRSDVMALRYLAAKEGIWDAVTNKPGSFTPEMLDKLYKSKELNTPMVTYDKYGATRNIPSPESLKPNDLKKVAPPKKPGMILERLRKRYRDSELLNLMNWLAKNEDAPPMDQAQNGTEMKFYQEGLDFKPKTISKNGSAIKDDRGQWAHPGEITEIGSNNITMQGVDYPVLGISDTGDTQMMYPDQDYKFDGEKVTEYPMAQDGENITKKLKKEAEEKLERMKKPKATLSQYIPKKGEQAKFDKQKLERIAEESAPLNRMAASKGAKNMQDAMEAALIMEGGLAASKLVGKGAKAAAKYATEQTALKNAYKLNPYAFKPTEGMMYRGLGKEGMEDALQSGLFRAKQNVTPTSIGNFNTTRQFSKAYYTPRFDIADQYGQGYIAEVPRGASDWGKRYGKKEWSQIAQRDIPVTEGKILQKDWLKRYKEVPKPTASEQVVRGPIPAPYKGTTLPYDNIGYKEPATGELAPYMTPEFEAIPYSELPKTVYHGGPSVISDAGAIRTTREGLPIQSATSPTSRGFYATPNTWMHMEGSPNPLRDVEGFYPKLASENAENYAMGRGDAYIHRGEFVENPRIVDWKTFSQMEPVKNLNPDFRRLSPEAAKIAEDLGIYGLRDNSEYNILNPQKVFKSFKPAYKNLGKGWEKYNKGGWLNKYK